MSKTRIDHARATIDALRARYGKGKTKLTDDQIAEGLEHYRPKAEVGIVVIDELEAESMIDKCADQAVDATSYALIDLMGDAASVPIWTGGHTCAARLDELPGGDAE